MRFVRQTRLQQNCCGLCVQEWSMRNFCVVSHAVVVDKQRWFGCFKPPSLHETCLELFLKGGCLITTKSFLIHQQHRHAIRRENFSYFTLERTSRSGFAVNAFAAQTASKLDNLNHLLFRTFSCCKRPSIAFIGIKLFARLQYLLAWCFQLAGRPLWKKFDSNGRFARLFRRWRISGDAFPQPVLPNTANVYKTKTSAHAR